MKSPSLQNRLHLAIRCWVALASCELSLDAQPTGTSAKNPASGGGVGVPAPVVTTPATLLQTTADAHAAWKREGGEEFHSGLVYADGTPFLMLFTSKGEPADRALRRKRSIVLACDFLLDEAAFQDAGVCVVELDPKKPREQSLTNYKLRRADFQRVAKNAGQTDNVKSAAQKARTDDALALKICADLGIK